MVTQMNNVGTEDMIVVAKALGDETRARIVGVLDVRALCVCELMAALGLSQATVSDHVRILVDAGLLTASKQSYWTVYSVRKDLPSETLQFLSRLAEQVHTAFPGDRTRLTDTPVFLCHIDSAKKTAPHPRTLHRKA
jgi:DNA-binding transcriptional ArsR family regulator